jgi:hypothetical protein
VSVIDCSTNVLSSIPINTNTGELLYIPSNNTVAIINVGYGVVDIMNSNAIIATISTPDSAVSTITYNSDNETLYVLDGTGNVMTVVNSSNIVTSTFSITCSGPIFSTYNPTDNMIYISDYSNGDVVVIDCNPNSTYLFVIDVDNSNKFGIRSDGGLFYTPGSQGIGKVLTSDNNGYATWELPAGGTAATHGIVALGTSSLIAGNAIVTPVTGANYILASRAGIFITDTSSDLTTVGSLSVNQATAGYTFSVTSTNPSDVSTFNWMIVI